MDINSTPCNGVTECSDGSDENGWHRVGKYIHSWCCIGETDHDSQKNPLWFYYKHVFFSMKSMGENLDWCLCDCVTNRLSHYQFGQFLSVSLSKCQVYSRAHKNLFFSITLGHSKFNLAISIDLDRWGLVLVKTGTRSWIWSKNIQVYVCPPVVSPGITWIGGG